MRVELYWKNQMGCIAPMYSALLSLKKERSQVGRVLERALGAFRGGVHDKSSPEI